MRHSEMHQVKFQLNFSKIENGILNNTMGQGQKLRYKSTLRAEESIKCWARHLAVIRPFQLGERLNDVEDPAIVREVGQSNYMIGKVGCMLCFSCQKLSLKQKQDEF